MDLVHRAKRSDSTDRVGLAGGLPGGTHDDALSLTYIQHLHVSNAKRGRSIAQVSRRKFLTGSGAVGLGRSPCWLLGNRRRPRRSPDLASLLSSTMSDRNLGRSSSRSARPIWQHCPYSVGYRPTGGCNTTTVVSTGVTTPTWSNPAPKWPTSRIGTTPALCRSFTSTSCAVRGRWTTRRRRYSWTVSSTVPACPRGPRVSLPPSWPSGSFRSWPRKESLTVRFGSRSLRPPRRIHQAPGGFRTMASLATPVTPRSPWNT